MALKDVEIRALKATDRIYKRTDERGLYIEVHPSGSKLWRLKYRYLGKDKRIALGRKLAARRRAMEVGFAAIVVAMGGYVTAQAL